MTYQPASSALDVGITLYGGIDSTAAVASEDCLAHPASFNTNLAPLIEGPIISLAPKHAKVRRDGYRR